MSTGPPLLRRCVPTVPDACGSSRSSSRKVTRSGEDAVSCQTKEESMGVSTWRVANIQDSLCELIKQQSGLSRAIHDVAEMQQEMREFLRESQQCLEKKLTDVSQTKLRFQLIPDPQSEEDRQSGRGCEAAEKKSSAKPDAMADQDRVQAILNAKQRKQAACQHEPAPKPKRLSRLQQLVSSPAFDIVMGLVVMLNSGFIFLEMELKGWDLDFQLGKRPDSGDWPAAKSSFRAIEACFNVIFLLELLLRLMAFGRHLFRHPAEAIDAFVIALSAIDIFVLEAIVGGMRQTRILGLLRVTRILRTLRLIRFLRVVKLMKFLSPLRVLIHAICASMDSLLWSLVVMGCIICSSALLMVNLVTDFLEDASNSLEDREWVYMYFGSAMKASYTMFEATFSGIWASRLSRRMASTISPWFLLFWCGYTCLVNFAVFRVISALFLKRTLEVAQVDADRIALAKMKEKQQTVATIREVFRHADQLGDGVLHRWEFEEMMENHEVLKLFEEVELEAPQLHLLFDLVEKDDAVEIEEFLAGAVKLRSREVKPVDVIQIIHETCVLKRHLDDCKGGISRLDEVLHPEKPWRPISCKASKKSAAKRLASLIGQDFTNGGHMRAETIVMS